jgi:stage II sporulation protein D
VSGTRRLVLVRPGTTQTVSAHFHADCGGTTERASSVWMASAEAAPRPETITGCPVRSARSWGRYISLEEIASVFGRTATGLRSVVVLARNESGRVERVRLVDDAGRSHLVTGAQFRMRLGHDRIRSTRFELREVRREGAVVGAQVTGVGAGHGVGLCQRGAAGLARMGRTHREILRHYYPDAELWEGRSASVSPKKP